MDDKLKNRVQDAVLKEYNKIGYREGYQSAFQPASACQDDGVYAHQFDVGCNRQHGTVLLRIYAERRYSSRTIIRLPMPMNLPIFWVLPTRERRISTVISSVRHHRIRVKFSGYYHILPHVLYNVFDILGEKEGEKYLKHIRPEIIQLLKSDRQYWQGKDARHWMPPRISSSNSIWEATM